MTSAHCKGPACRARILWTTVPETGAKMCLDVEAVPLDEAAREPRGMYYLDEHGRAVKWTPTILADVGALYRSHWITCVDRDSFRGR